MGEQPKWVQVVLGPRFPGTPFHAVIMVPMLLILVVPRLWTLVVLMSVVAFMGYLQMTGRSFTWFVRDIKRRLRGGRVQARPVWYRRRKSTLLHVAALPNRSE